MLEKGNKMSDSENIYPFVLSYTKPNGREMIEVVLNEDESERAFFHMFDSCGMDVPYAVDVVS